MPAFVIHSEVSFPATRINGEKKKRAILRSGDLIEVGKNQFRFVTD